MNSREFGRYLLKIRTNNLKISLKKMHSKCGLSVNTLTSLERGGILRPETETIVKASEGYGLSKKTFDDIFFPDEYKLKEENEKADALLKKIQSKKTFQMKPIAGRHVDLGDYGLPLEIKKYIIHLYEELSGEKLKP